MFFREQPPDIFASTADLLLQLLFQVIQVSVSANIIRRVLHTRYWKIEIGICRLVFDMLRLKYHHHPWHIRQSDNRVYQLVLWMVQKYGMDVFDVEEKVGQVEKPDCSEHAENGHVQRLVGWSEIS
jgi:hypothetical protein